MNDRKVEYFKIISILIIYPNFLLHLTLYLFCVGVRRVSKGYFFFFISVSKCHVFYQDAAIYKVFCCRSLEHLLKNHNRFCY